MKDYHKKKEEELQELERKLENIIKKSDYQNKALKKLLLSSKPEDGDELGSEKKEKFNK